MFAIQNPYCQVIQNLKSLDKEQDKLIALEEKEIEYITFSVQNNNGGKAFLGRGLALTGGNYVARYRVPTNIVLQYIILYFDNEAIQGWTGTESFGVLFYLEDPDYGEAPPTHPPCGDLQPGSGTNLFPGGGPNDFHYVPRNEILCLNHGRNPKNGIAGPLLSRAYTIIDLVPTKCEAGSSLSCRVDPSSMLQDGTKRSAPPSCTIQRIGRKSPVIFSNL